MADLLIKKNISQIEDLVSSIDVMSQEGFMNTRQNLSRFIRYRLQAPELAYDFEQEDDKNKARELLEALNPVVEVPAENLTEVINYAANLPEEQFKSWVARKDVRKNLEEMTGFKGVSKKLTRVENVYEFADMVMGGGSDDFSWLPEPIAPSEIKSYLDRYVIGQDDAKRQISSLLHRHVKRIRALEIDGKELRCPHSFVIGSHGTGKTYLVNKAVEYVGLPFFEADMAEYSSTGYHGSNISELPLLISQKYEENDLSEYCVVLLDEIDKKHGNSSDLDVSGKRVQHELLKILDGKEINVQAMDAQGQVYEVPLAGTGQMLFFLAGAFSDIWMNSKNSIGVNQRVDSKKQFDYKKLTSNDLQEYGMIPELLRRAPVVSYLDNLEEKDLVNILKHSQDSPLLGFTEECEEMGFELELGDDAFSYIASEAKKKGLGASGLDAVCYNIIQEFDYALPSIKQGQKIVLGAEDCANPREYVDKLMKYGA